MALTCNIDARGKAVRLRIGIVLTLVGIMGALGIALFGLPGGTGAWLVVVALLTSGGFSIFEARAGWCAVRALGFRTPV